MFLTVLNMSITASYVILAVLLIRLLLARTPKKYSYWLWGVVGFRLCCPFSFESVFSLFSLKPFDMAKAQTATAHQLQYITADPNLIRTEITTGIPYANSLIPEPAPTAELTSISPSQFWIPVLGLLWLIGAAALLLWGLISYLHLARRMRTAIRIEGNLYASDQVGSPFILGFFKPKIYLPFGVEEGYIIEHERYHLRHLDHWVKLFGFLLLCLYWFNPLCWLAFHLMGRDMEMRCDEEVLKRNSGIAKAYSTALLSFAANRRFPSPLAFSESGVKKRIRNVLRWKEPAKWIRVIAILLCLTALMGCAANPRKEEVSAGTEMIQPEIIETGCPDITVELQKSALRCEEPYMQLRWVNSSARDIVLQSKFTVLRQEEDWVSTDTQSGKVDQSYAGLTLKAGKAEIIHYKLGQFDLDTMGSYRFLQDFHFADDPAVTHTLKLKFFLNAPTLMQVRITVEEDGRIVGGDVNNLQFRPNMIWDFSHLGVTLEIGSVTEDYAEVTLFGETYSIHRETTTVEQNGVTVELTLMDEVPTPTDYYIYKGNDADLVFTPSLTLNAETGSFSFHWDPASSYFASGLYTVEDGILTAFTGDGKNTYRFRVVDEDTLAFIKGASSEVPAYVTEPIEDGAVFTKKLAS